MKLDLYLVDTHGHTGITVAIITAQCGMQNEKRNKVNEVCDKRCEKRNPHTYTHTHEPPQLQLVLWLLFLLIYEYLADLVEKKNMFLRGTRKYKKHCSKNTTKTKAITMHNVQLTMYKYHTHTHTHTPKLFIQICILNLRHHRATYLHLRV